MYEQFYNFNDNPFALNPDPRFCYSHPSYKKAKAYMSYALDRGEGFLLITGKPGTGKTTLIKELMKDMDPQKFKVTTLVTTQLEADDLLHSVAYSYDLPVENANKATIIMKLKEYLTQRRRQKQHTVLVVDEAQDLSLRALEELRLLTNLELDYQPLLQIFLVGQPQLFDTLSSNSMEQLRQRITVAAAMQPLNLEQLEEYIQNRLAIAGWQQDPIISKEVYQSIYQNSDGIPRRINQICSRLLLHGFVEEKHNLDIDDINAVLEELNEEQLSVTHSILTPQNIVEDDYVSHPDALINKELH